MGVEVKGLLLVSVEETQDFNEDLAHFRVELDVVFGLLAYTEWEKFKGLVDFVVAVFLRKLFFHPVENVEKFKQPVQTADQLDFKETFFVQFFIRFAVKVLGGLVDHVNELFQIQSDLEVLFLNFNPHLGQLDVLLDLARVQKTKSLPIYY